MNTYRCPNEKRCPIHKHCVVLKTGHKLENPLEIFYKCPNGKKEIKLNIQPNSCD